MSPVTTEHIKELLERLDRLEAQNEEAMARADAAEAESRRLTAERYAEHKKEQRLHRRIAVAAEILGPSAGKFSANDHGAGWSVRNALALADMLIAEAEASEAAREAIRGGE